ncbi:DNA gyrase inhibitor YacG [Aristophania vespae]|uniref:DNA gyrase inhibitor YacG n=1 Tax=Aristophania vespae TaxID=2697033 RepID=A0A6P1NI50_9PROT|nr:DNA gyrase inhibitor YacG [Aristophania vespae]QHI96210.1 DNA gyrase inhibitor YacG [Aristophania vespae]UMM64007.1 DNA gyrase inhibitor YacG [Aristophania vespae]
MCPICQQPTDQKFRPFCSQRCADIDLGRWFSGQYRVPSYREDDEENETILPQDEDPLQKG